MGIRHLTEPIFDDGLRAINFFNGRLLSAEDMSTQALAHEQIDRRLAMALGDGVAYGLEVSEKAGVSTRTNPVITIRPGLALNREGQTLKLAGAVDLALTAAPVATGGTPAVVPFFTCQEQKAGVYVAGAGLYLLTISPVAGHEGLAQVSGLGNGTASCGARKYQREGVKFRLIAIELSSTDLAEGRRLRNLLAYRCFGVEDAGYRSFFANPFGPPVEQYGLLDDLRPNRLADCEVPLALVYVTAADGLAFLDMWAVRRRLTAPAPRVWPLLTGDRRISETEAMFRQFQDQIEHIRARGGETPAAIIARERFRYLPPVGILPLLDGRAPQGFHPDLFFEGITHHPVMYVEGARVAALVRNMLHYPPVDLREGVSLWIYRVRENAEAIAGGSSLAAPPPYLIFSTGHMAYMGDPHYDVNRWEYANRL